VVLKKTNKKNVDSFSFFFKINTLPPSDSETEKNILEDLFSSVLSQFKKYRTFGNLNFIIEPFLKLKIWYFNGKKFFQFLLS